LCVNLKNEIPSVNYGDMYADCTLTVSYGNFVGIINGQKNMGMAKSQLEILIEGRRELFEITKWFMK